MPTLVLLRPRAVAVELEKPLHRLVGCRLTEKGIGEARAAGHLMRDRGIDFDCCFHQRAGSRHPDASPRAPRNGRLWLPVTKDWRLNERHYGGLTGLNKQEMIDKVGADQVQIWRRSFDIPPPPLPQDSPYDVADAGAMPGSRFRNPRASGHDRALAAIL